jgi:Fe-S cluster assembly protein SufD
MDLPLFLPAAGDLGDRAARGRDAAADLGLPSERDDIWRYTDVSVVDLGVVAPGPLSLEVEGADTEPFGEGLGLIDPDQDIFTAVNAGYGGGVAIRLRPGRSTVRITARGSGGAHLPQVAIEAPPGAEGTVVLNHGGDAAYSLPICEVSVGENAHVTLIEVEETAAHTVHIATTRARIARYGRLRSLSVALGGRLSRLRMESFLAEPDAESEMLGLYFAEGDQRVDFRTLQRHDAPRCRSEVLFKGAVADHSRAVYSGLIYVAKGAQKTDGYQTNRNIVLSEGAWAESIPQLEILANDVRCSHASAVGPLDEDHLYYLESRGLDPQTARRLVVFGFYEDVLGRVAEPAIQAGLRLAVAGKWARAAADVG